MFGFLKHIFRLQFLVIALAIIAGIYYAEIKQFLKDLTWQYLQETTGVTDDESISLQYTANNNKKVLELFTAAQLAQYDGTDDRPLYLALLGSVYDVTRGRKHYGSGCAYNFFIGRDASVAFVTGEFEHYDALQGDDVLQLKPSDLLGLAHWQRFYENDYIYKGKLIGRFFDANGEPTTYYHKYLALLEQAEQAKSQDEELRMLYPDCNIEWSEARGTHVWCTPNSGGMERDWVGYPRKFYEAGYNRFRCACIREEDLETTAIMIKPYDDCEHRAQECFYRV